MTPAETATPETDAARFIVSQTGKTIFVVDDDFARNLERQRDEARAKLELFSSPEVKDALKEFTIKMMWAHKARADKAEAERDTALASANKMREALEKITKLRWGWDGDCGTLAIAEDALSESGTITGEQPSTQWQPIATAPKDSKARLVWCPERIGTLSEVPTHWMPLPESPGTLPSSPEEGAPCVICNCPITQFDSYGVGVGIGHRYHWSCVRREAATVGDGQPEAGQTGESPGTIMGGEEKDAYPIINVDGSQMRSYDRLRADLARVTGEVARLTDCLNGANANHEEFERKWYLATYENEDLRATISALEGEREGILRRADAIAELSMCHKLELETAKERIATLEAGIADRDADKARLDLLEKERPDIRYGSEAIVQIGHYGDYVYAVNLTFREAIDAVIVRLREEGN